MTITMTATQVANRGDFTVVVVDDDGSPIAVDLLLQITNAEGWHTQDIPFTTDVSGTTDIAVPCNCGTSGEWSFNLVLAPDSSVASTTCHGVNY